MKKTVFGLSLIIFLLSGCACPQKTPEDTVVATQTDDPLEPLNRSIFAFNMALDKLILKPMAQGYRYVVPEPARKGVNNFFFNLKQPLYLVNALLQGEGKTAGDISKRFLANTFWGFLGVFDVASEMNIPKKTNDFGQTLATWGWHNSSPYLVLPVFGPSNPRDTIGIGVDLALTPIDWILRNDPTLLYSRIVLENWDKREKGLDLLDNLERSSTDFYATTRSMYQQNRRNKIAETTQESSGITAEYEFDFEIEEDE